MNLNDADTPGVEVERCQCGERSCSLVRAIQTLSTSVGDAESRNQTIHNTPFQENGTVTVMAPWP